MIKEFGDLKGDSRYFGSVLSDIDSSRRGYAALPSAGEANGEVYRRIGLDEILDSEFWKKQLFNDMRSYWQTSLLQPKGGMDMIWQRLLKYPFTVNGGD